MVRVRGPASARSVIASNEKMLGAQAVWKPAASALANCWMDASSAFAPSPPRSPSEIPIRIPFICSPSRRSPVAGRHVHVACRDHLTCEAQLRRHTVALFGLVLEPCLSCDPSVAAQDAYRAASAQALSTAGLRDR